MLAAKQSRKCFAPDLWAGPTRWRPGPSRARNTEGMAIPYRGMWAMWCYEDDDWDPRWHSHSSQAARPENRAFTASGGWGWTTPCARFSALPEPLRPAWSEGGRSEQPRPARGVRMAWGSWVDLPGSRNPVIAVDTNLLVYAHPREARLGDQMHRIMARLANVDRPCPGRAARSPWV